MDDTFKNFGIFFWKKDLKIQIFKYAKNEHRIKIK